MRRAPMQASPRAPRQRMPLRKPALEVDWMIRAALAAHPRDVLCINFLARERRPRPDAYRLKMKTSARRSITFSETASERSLSSRSARR